MMPQRACSSSSTVSGQVTVFCGATEIGRAPTTCSAIVAEVLGIDAYDVRCVTGDTGLTPVTSARIQPRHRDDGQCRDPGCRAPARSHPQALAGTMETLPENVGFARGRVFRADDPGKPMSFRERSSSPRRNSARSARGSYSPPRSPGPLTKARGSGPRRVLLHGLRLEAEVDPKPAGSHPEVWIAHDIGPRHTRSARAAGRR